MSRIEAWAALGAGLTLALPVLVAHRRKTARPQAGRGARFLLWVAIASPLLFLLTHEGDRFRVFVSGPGGRFEAFRVLAFCAASAAVVASVRPVVRRWWSTLLVVFLASAVGLGTATLLARFA